MDLLLARIKRLAAENRPAEAAEAARALAKWMAVVSVQCPEAGMLEEDLVRLRDATIRRQGLREAYQTYRRHLAKVEEVVATV